MPRNADEHRPVLPTLPTLPTLPPALLATLLEPFMDVDLDLADRRDGKVRVSYDCRDGCRLFVTTDRLSAFDRVVAGVPYKGQVLNQFAAWWFAETADIVANHVVAVPDPNVLVARTATPLPVEVVVRGYITGVTSTSLWRQYADGLRIVYGHQLPDGLAKNTVLPEAIITPTTKATDGAHDEPLSCADVVDRRLVEPGLWADVQAAALALFARGQQVAAAKGLILADTKYEFGLAADGSLLLIDEVHTPDSSRWWIAGSHADLVAAGAEPESLDKEVVRRALLDAGYTGQGLPPQLAPEIWAATATRYVDAYQRLTGLDFAPGSYPVQNRITEVLAHVP